MLLRVFSLPAQSSVARPGATTAVGRRRERASTKQESRAKKSSNQSPEKQAAKLEENLARLTAEKDEIENELVTCSMEGDASRLKRLNQTYEKLQKDHAAAEEALAALIASL